MNKCRKKHELLTFVTFINANSMALDAKSRYFFSSKNDTLRFAVNA